MAREVLPAAAERLSSSMPRTVRPIMSRVAFENMSDTKSCQISPSHLSFDQVLPGNTYVPEQLTSLS